MWKQTGVTVQRSWAIIVLWMGHDWPLPGVQSVAVLPVRKLSDFINVSA